MTNQYEGAVATARDYYNSEDADNFYHRVWGGEDIHIGLYESDEEAIPDASRRTVAHMGDLLGEPTSDMKVLDIGAGYGGAARYLATTFGCHVKALNLSEVENERDRQMNKALKLDHLVDVLDASFESIPAEDNSFDVVWSQDSILHSGNRMKVMEEVARVLKPGGVFIFTDPMQTDDAPKEKLQPILDRIHLETLGSPGFYREAASKVGLEEIGFEDHSHQLPRHYGRVLKELESREESLKGLISDDYIARMKKGLQHWVDGGKAGHLCWGIFRFRKA
ncbi:methyltransferase [Ectothiorhodospira haloalkaliphila]|uniref:Methyltransferase n=1 Tax=Ectothiorhodospira haloalkaliphila TaxID=421628 RepID=W8KHT7_9GAMM|nr:MULTISPECIES: methyltransferase domain-containing protein [Ectothiorhodospira]AHK78723.1 methyltransferase [Ectothiorhodospira haloalkaliphila]MCG5493866.1 methyltransferase domain-containing protein [Ectothiorhodospira variabilis]MCG5498080.1 methyltransferase domain-containing protein [Ectothiorhodospira variabilis]MCG5503669.1 methyltransferase domain-containing protein [Ectothiorhodospira variabilis]MCG5506825.1 methyltransferase domain-containing protein [Ectothiorhodospira variabilis]